MVFSEHDANFKALDSQPDPDDISMEISTQNYETSPDDCIEISTQNYEPDPDDSIEINTQNYEPGLDDRIEISKESYEPDPDDSVKIELMESENEIEREKERNEFEQDLDDEELQRIQDPVMTLVKIVKNVIQHPDEIKFEKLRKANPVIQKNIASYNGENLFVILLINFKLSKWQIGLSGKFNAGVSFVNEEVKYVTAGTTMGLLVKWQCWNNNGAFGKVAKAGQVAGFKSTEEISMYGP
ncbi:hypothetical protein LXL04_017461 [Taraxacum kok-saghyz]